MSLTPDQVAIVKSTASVVAEHGEAITSIFYSQMFDKHPALKSVFNQSNQKTGHQQRALATALFAYAANIDALGNLSPAVELICQKHASLYIKPEQYAIVGEHLLAAMGQVLGAALTAEILDAWTAAYWQLANLFIGREKELMDSTQGWDSWRQFRIARKVPESDEITSFYLVPVDGKPLPPFKPGQYVSVQFDIPELGHSQIRQYSLSDAPSQEHYRISVKRERGAHPGTISSLLHDSKKEGDVMDVSHPFGNFHFAPESYAPDTPVVLISAGVGLTCLVSIMNTLIQTDDATTAAAASKHPITFVHAARTSPSRAFGDHVRALKATHPQLRTVLFTKTPAETDAQGKDFHHSGRLDLNKLDRGKDLHLGDKRTQYFVCGPSSFMTDVKRALGEKGIEPERVHVELFGTGGIGMA